LSLPINAIMGAGASHPHERTSLLRGLGASIRDFMRPTRAQIQQVWEDHDRDHSGALNREQVKHVLNDLIDKQITQADSEAKNVKRDMAKQQAQMEKMCRLQRAEVMEKGESVSTDSLDRAVALVMGSGTGPVMAGMMAGYMDIPLTCLTAMKEDKDLIEARVNLLFRLGANKDGLLTQEEFATNYLNFFDNAPRVLGDGGSTDSGECVLQ